MPAPAPGVKGRPRLSQPNPAMLTWDADMTRVPPVAFELRTLVRDKENLSGGLEVVEKSIWTCWIKNIWNKSKPSSRKRSGRGVTSKSRCWSKGDHDVPSSDQSYQTLVTRGYDIFPLIENSLSFTFYSIAGGNIYDPCLLVL